LIRPATLADIDAILGLNAEWEHFTSPLDPSGLVRLHGQSAYHRVVEVDGRVVAFLLALLEGADYASRNYRWFADAEGEPFLYVDRIVVALTEQGSGLGAALYDDLFAFAGAEGIGRIVCEVDIEPPNGISSGFHDRYGFMEVGTQWVGGGAKRVSLREAAVGV
jgi:predicted GNAT superfamily acetyltransferase